MSFSPQVEEPSFSQVELFQKKVEELAREKVQGWTFPLTHYSYHSVSIRAGIVTVWFSENQGSDFRGIPLSDEDVYG